MNSPEKCKTPELQELQEFIQSNPAPRELKRALAVKMLIEGLKPRKIQDILEVSVAFISRCKADYAWSGVQGLKLKHKGSKGYLSSSDRQQIIEWIKNQKQVELRKLEDYIEGRYDIKFKAKKSYYALLKEAGMSWKKTQKTNPKRDEALVKKKHQEICNLLAANREEIETGKLAVYLIDECHLLWGDVCGYVWGITQERLEIPITNERKRQTYYGALNYQTQQFFVREYDQGNTKNTVLFLKELIALNPWGRILIIWDGASYHKSDEIKSYLNQVNQGLKPEDFQVNCVLLAPNAPEQNPVEDIWLQAKNCLRKFWYRFNSFALTKWFFAWIIQGQFFEFPKLHKYGVFPQKLGAANA